MLCGQRACSSQYLATASSLTDPSLSPAACIQMGMGKTACAVGAVQMNPPPAGWRKNRAWQTLRREDMLGEQPSSQKQALVANNLGGWGWGVWL